MRTIIIGGVAGGMSAATRLRRLDESREIIVLERGEHVSFANCGLPYFAGGVIEDREELLLQTPQSLKKRFNLDVRIKHELVSINPDSNSIEVKNLVSGELFSLDYDNLILSMGASPVILPIKGREKLFTLRNIFDVDILVDEIQKAKTGSNKAIVIGAGFIGVEIAENFVKQGLQVTLVEMAPQVLPPLDTELASYVAEELKDHGVDLKLGISVDSVEEKSATLSDGNKVEADLVFASVGVSPEISIAKEAGIKIGERGGVKTNSAMQTNFNNIYAVGDMVEKIDLISGDSTLVALANIANKQGRRAADAIVGIAPNIKSNKALGTAVVQVFGLTVAMTGASKRRLEQSGRDHVSIHTHPNNHAGYYPGAEQMHLIVHIDPISGEIFGAQGVGPTDVARRIDVLSTAIAGGLTAMDLIDLELAYAPQYGSAKDPINMIGYIADGIVNGKDKTISAADLEGKVLIDVRSRQEFQEGAIPGAINIDIDELRERHGEIPAKSVVVYCQIGQRGHSAALMLSQLGYDVANLAGGYQTWLNSLKIGESRF